MRSEEIGRARTALVVLGACAILDACGAGTAAAVAGSGGSSGGGNSPPVMAAFRLEHAKVAPARIRFVLSDPESNPAEVSLFCAVNGGPAHALMQVAALPSGSAMLATTPGGIAYDLAWTFTSESVLPRDGSFSDDVTVYATVEDGIQEIVLGANAARIGVGNDAPEAVPPGVPTAEVSGIVGVELTVSDSSDDVVSVRVEYDVEDDVPDAGWRLARPALAQETPPFGLDNVIAEHTGSTVAFFWDTDVDLAHAEHDARLRFTVIDHDEEGELLASSAPFATAPFHVDNNREPSADLQAEALFVSGDRRRGIPISYSVSDPEDDPVQLVLQWRRPDQTFPPLPQDPAAMNAALADPVQRKALQIAEPFPVAFEGRVDPRDAASVRLPELATTEAPLVALGVVGSKLELLRSGTKLRPLSATWSPDPLAHPLAVVPLGDGTEALALDRPATNAWRLRRIALATGEVRAEIATGQGEPDAVCVERGERSVLVAAHVLDAWELVRVDLERGTQTTLCTSVDSTELGPVHGIASLGTNAALITVDDALVRVDWTDARAPRASTLVEGLAAPRGIALDPLRARRVYVAERDGDASPELPGAGRVLAIELDTLVVRQVTTLIHDPSEPELPQPTALALDRGGSRLLVVTSATPGEAELRSVDLGGASRNEVFLREPTLPAGTAALAAGEQDLLVLVSGDAVLAGGGRIQRRTITAYDTASQVVSVAPPFDPAPRPGERWRVAHTGRANSSTPAGASGTLVWNSADAESDQVFLKATPFDSELGAASESGIAFDLDGLWEREPVSVGGPGVTNDPQAFTFADLDGDGDQDLAVGRSSGVTGALLLFFQVRPREFTSTPLVLGGSLAQYNVFAVIAADLDGDRDLDLATTSIFGSRLVLFFQTSSGSFGPPVQLSGAPLNIPQALAACDVDRDGDLDLAVADWPTDNLGLFFQSSPGVFPSTPTLLPTHDAPQQLAAVDVEGDGDVDLVAANTFASDVQVFERTHAGAFVPRTLSLPAGTEPRWLAAGDLDTDGDVDLAMNSDIVPPIQFFTQLNAGEFDPLPRAIGVTLALATGGFAAADVDHDGDQDLVSAGERLNVFFQTAPGAFATSPRRIGGASGAAGPFGIRVDDVDGDGRVDVAYTSVQTDDVGMHFGSGPESFERNSTPLPQRIRQVGDLDADGDRDLVALGPADIDDVILSFQTSPGVFTPTVLHLPDFITTIDALGDLDGDGLVDLVSANPGQTFLVDTLTIFFQRAPGTFDPEPLVLGGSGITNPWQMVVIAADLDQDGDLDLACPNRSLNNVTVFFQTGAGVFATVPLRLGSTFSTRNPISLTAADLDGDGDADLAAANQSSNNVAVFFQTSPGTYDPNALRLGTTAMVDSPQQIHAADMDGDGDLDLVTPNSGGNNVSIFFQTSPGVFAVAPVRVGGPATTPNVSSVVLADLDGDGDQDLVCGLFAPSSHVAIFHQIGPGVFESQPSTVDGPSAVVAVTDLDGDGDPDVVHQSGVLWGQH